MSRKIAEIEARERAATKGPWHACDDDGVPTVAPGADCSTQQSFIAVQFAEEDDAAFIAAAREDIPALCAALRIAVGALRRQCQCTSEGARPGEKWDCPRFPCKAGIAMREIAALIEVEET